MKVNDSRAKPGDDSEADLFFWLCAKLHEPEELSIPCIKQRTLVILLSGFGCGCFLSDLSATAIQPHMRLGVTLSCSNINNTKNDIRYISISISSHMCNICTGGKCFPSPSWSGECQRLLSFDLFHCFPLVLDCILHPITVFSLNWRIIGGADVFLQKPSVK